MSKISELIGMVKTGLTLAWAIPLLRYIVILVAGYTLFMLILCIHLERRPSRGLFRPKKKSNVERMSLGELKARVHDNPESWLLYEDEIFFVPDPGSLTGEKREAYDAALSRLENGGKEARMVGKRVYLERRDAKAYRRFLYSLYQKGPKRAKQAVAAPAPEQPGA